MPNLEEKMQYDYTVEQLLDENLKNKLLLSVIVCLKVNYIVEQRKEWMKR